VLGVLPTTCDAATGSKHHGPVSREQSLKGGLVVLADKRLEQLGVCALAVRLRASQPSNIVEKRRWSACHGSALPTAFRPTLLEPCQRPASTVFSDFFARPEFGRPRTRMTVYSSNALTEANS